MSPLFPHRNGYSSLGPLHPRSHPLHFPVVSVPASYPFPFLRLARRVQLLLPPQKEKKGRTGKRLCYIIGQSLPSRFFVFVNRGRGFLTHFINISRESTHRKKKKNYLPCEPLIESTSPKNTGDVTHLVGPTPRLVCFRVPKDRDVFDNRDLSRWLHPSGRVNTLLISHRWYYYCPIIIFTSKYSWLVYTKTRSGS